MDGLSFNDRVLNWERGVNENWKGGCLWISVLNIEGVSEKKRGRNRVIVA